MPTVNDAKNAVLDGLAGMGYNPINLVMTELITDSKDGYWNIKGEFKGGFMGEVYKFDLKYDPSNNGLANIKVSAYPSKDGYA